MKPASPQRIANELTIVLRAAGADEFPVNVRTVALEISKAKYPDAPIAVVKGEVLPGFEGALTPAPPGKKGWGIFYNSAISSRGRINFTLGHEFGHYLLHREAYPDGFQCSTEDMAAWESEYGQRENEANIFAATFLMPFDDFRQQIGADKRPGFDQLGHYAERYDVSLIAATLRWLQYTSRRAMLVVSRDGFILWARSSQPALRSGLFFRTRNRPPVDVPPRSLAANPTLMSGPARSRDFGADVWLNQPCTEHVILSGQYDFTLSLLHFSDGESRFEPLDEPVEDAADRMRSRLPGQSWLS
jgi:hypothetical protein